MNPAHVVVIMNASPKRVPDGGNHADGAATGLFIALMFALVMFGVYVWVKETEND